MFENFTLSDGRVITLLPRYGFVVLPEEVPQNLRQKVVGEGVWYRPFPPRTSDDQLCFISLAMLLAEQRSDALGSEAGQVTRIRLTS